MMVRKDTIALHLYFEFSFLKVDKFCNKYKTQLLFTFTLALSVQLSWLIANLIVLKEGITHWKRKMLWENCVKSISWAKCASFIRISHPYVK